MSRAALIVGVAKCTIKVLFCYLKQSTANRRATRPSKFALLRWEVLYM
eukprot:COSAG01_NODE_208_length_21996_cov_31.972097_7_plen_48_part_00